MELTDVQQLRKDIDSVAQLSELVSPETSKSLFFAKAWAGKLMGTLGSESPYKNDGKRKTVADIEPTDARVELEIKPSENKVEEIDNLRQLIAVLISNLEKFDGFSFSRHGSICRTQVWIYLNESRFHLGFELEKMYKQAKS